MTSRCGQNKGVKGPQPSFTLRLVAKTEGCNERGLPSPPGLWAKPRSERSAAFLHLSVCGENRGVKGAWPSFTSRFVGKTTSERSTAFIHFSVCGQSRGVKGPQPWVCGENRGVKGGPQPWVCGQNRGVKGARPSRTGKKGGGGGLSPFGLWSKPCREGTAAFLHFSVCGQNRGEKTPAFLHSAQAGEGPRPSFTARFVAKTKG